MLTREPSHLIAESLNPIEHLSLCCLVHTATALSNGFNDCGIGLESVEGGDGILSPSSVYQKHHLLY